MNQLEKKKIKIKKGFNKIAPLFKAGDSVLKAYFRPSLEKLVEEVDLKGKTVLDVGTGTGVWAFLMTEKGAIVHGVDFAERMLIKARELYGDKITFSIGDAENLSEFKDNSFDIVTASFVLHGSVKEVRMKMLVEMKRISKNLVVINDFGAKPSLIMRFIEFIEGSDYKNFIRDFHSEMKEHFSETKKINVLKGTPVYIGKKK